MLTKVRRLGNSRGILIPKPLLRQAGLEDNAEILVKGSTLVLRNPKRATRSGWAEVSILLAACGDDRLILPQLATQADKDLQW